VSGTNDANGRDSEPDGAAEPSALDSEQGLQDEATEGTADPGTYRLLAEHRAQRGDHEGALAVLERGLRFAGALPELLAHRGHVLIGASRYQEALEALEWAVSVDPELVEAQYDRAIGLGYLRRFDECLAQAEKVLTLQPAHTGAMHAKAEALRLLQRFDEARQVTEELLRAKPDDGDVHRQYTLILSAQGSSEEALQAADRWVEVSPHDSDAHRSRAQLLAELGRIDAAAEAYDAAIERDPENVEAYLGKATLLTQMPLENEELLTRHLALIDAALAADPRHTVALRQRAWLLWTLDHNAEAVRAADRAAAVDPPPDPWLLGVRADALYDLGRYTEAVESYEAAASGREGEGLNATQRIRHASALRMLNRLDEATSVLDDVLAEEPTNGKALAQRAELYRLVADNDKALMLLDQAIAAGNRSAFVLGTKGQVLVALERYDEAVPPLEDAIADDPTAAWAHMALADSLRMLDRFDEAVAAFDRAIELNPDDRALASARCEAVRLSGDAQRAIKLADAILAEAPDDDFTNGTRAAALNDLSRPNEALEAIAPTLERSPGYAFGWTVRVTALARLDHHTEAHAAIDTLLALEPTDPWSVTAKAALWLDQGRYDEALAFLNRREAEMRPDGDYRYLQGMALSRLDRLDEAQTRLRRAIELDPSINIATELGDVVALTGDEKGALGLRQEALQMLHTDRPPQAIELASAAWCAFHLGDLETAVRYLLQATSLDAYETEWQLKLALTQLAAGQRGVGVEQLDSWTTAVAKCPDRTRAAGLVREGNESVRRADHFGLLAGLPENVRHQLDDRLQQAERSVAVSEAAGLEGAR
jgi:tetratricopeptide (TPR) repeat protein